MGSGGVQKQLSQKTPCSKKKTSPTLIQSNSHMATCPYSSNNIIRGTGNGERETDSKEEFEDRLNRLEMITSKIFTNGYFANSKTQNSSDTLKSTKIINSGYNTKYQSHISPD